MAHHRVSITITLDVEAPADKGLSVDDLNDIQTGVEVAIELADADGLITHNKLLDIKGWAVDVSSASIVH